MKYNDKYTAKLILHKSGNYMRLSLVIFVTMIALVCFSLLFYLSYSEDNSKNYTENKIVHVLSVDGKLENSTYRDLKPTDKSDLNKYLKNKNIDASVEFFYSFNGATVDEDTMVLIIGVDKNAEHYISESKMSDNTLYTTDFDSPQLEINIPQLEIDDNGNVNANRTINKEYSRKDAIKNKVINYFSNGFDDLKKVYVTEKTYMDILQLSNKNKNAQNKSEVQDETYSNIIVDSAYINVTNLNDIDNLAKNLIDKGYDIQYTFSAFDAMGTSLRKNGILFFIMILILLIVASVNLVLSLMSYIDMSKKDMGVLKFMGYDSRRIYNIYKRNINRIFILLAFVAEICICTLTSITITNSIGSIIISMSLGMISLLILLNLILNKFYLKKVTKNNLLYLIKETKQFE